MKKLLTLLLTTLIAFSANAYNEVSFYVFAHPDDWQLFMGVYAYNDMTNTNGKVVFIQITAGTSNANLSYNAMTAPDMVKPYYLAREDGAMSSIRLACDGSYNNGNNYRPWSPSSLKQSYQTFQNVPSWNACGAYQERTHSIRRVEYRNTVTYFLRLPDNGDLNANPNTLHNLRVATCNSPLLVTPVDNSDPQNGYNSWNDLVKTVRAITVFEAGSVSNTFLNVHDLDQSSDMNPGDNEDHLDAARTVLDDPYRIMPTLTYYQGYVTALRPVNLSTRDIIKEAGLYAAYNTSKVLAGAVSDWIPDTPLPGNAYPDNDWTARCYARDSQSPSYGSYARTAAAPETQVVIAKSSFDAPAAVSLFPNPVEESFAIRSTATGRVKLMLLTTNGQTVPGFKIHYVDITKGDNQVLLNRKEIPEGNYVLRISSENKGLNSSHRLSLK